MTDKKCEDCVSYDGNEGCKKEHYNSCPTSVCMFEDEIGYTGCSAFESNGVKKPSGDIDGEPKGNQKYDRTIIGKYDTGSCVIDAYRIIDACNINIPQLQHAAKKILFTGQRGHKDLREDLKDILDSVQSAIDMIEDKESTK